MEKIIKVSVIIPIHNSSKTLHFCLESIFDTDYSNFEVIVIDDGSTDNPLKIAEKFPCQIIRSGQNKGPAVARNIGIKKAQGEILLFTDSDCTVQKNWIKRMVEEYVKLENDVGNIGVMGGRVLPNKRFVSKCVAYSGYYAFQWGDNPIERPDLCGANLLVLKKVFEEVGGFNGRLLNGEDTDLTCKIYEKKYKVIYHPSIYVIHNHEKTLYDFFQHQRFWGQIHGLQLEIRYQKIRKLKSFLLIKNPYLYLLFLALPVSLYITFLSIKTNFKFDKKILLYAPFVFISKLYYRIGVVEWLFKKRHTKK